MAHAWDFPRGVRTRPPGPTVAPEDAVQGEPWWFYWRQFGDRDASGMDKVAITGSRGAGCIRGLNRFETVAATAEKIRGERPRNPVPTAAMYGSALEDVGIREGAAAVRQQDGARLACQARGLVRLRTPDLAMLDGPREDADAVARFVGLDTGYGVVGSSPDGFSETPQHGKVSVEIKTKMKLMAPARPPAKRKRTRAKRGLRANPHYQLQVYMHMWADHTDKCLFVVATPTDVHVEWIPRADRVPVTRQALLDGHLALRDVDRFVADGILVPAPGRARAHAYVCPGLSPVLSRIFFAFWRGIATEGGPRTDAAWGNWSMGIGDGPWTWTRMPEAHRLVRVALAAAADAATPVYHGPPLAAWPVRVPRHLHGASGARQMACAHFPGWDTAHEWFTEWWDKHGPLPHRARDVHYAKWGVVHREQRADDDDDGARAWVAVSAADLFRRAGLAWPGVSKFGARTEARLEWEVFDTVDLKADGRPRRYSFVQGVGGRNRPFKLEFGAFGLQVLPDAGVYVAAYFPAGSAAVHVHAGPWRRGAPWRVLDLVPDVLQGRTNHGRNPMMETWPVET